MLTNFALSSFLEGVLRDFLRVTYLLQVGKCRCAKLQYAPDGVLMLGTVMLYTKITSKQKKKSSFWEFPNFKCIHGKNKATCIMDRVY